MGQKPLKGGVSRSWGPFRAKHLPTKFDRPPNEDPVNPMCPLGLEIWDAYSLARRCRCVGIWPLADSEQYTGAYLSGASRTAYARRNPTWTVAAVWDSVDRPSLRPWPRPRHRINSIPRWCRGRYGPLPPTRIPHARHARNAKALASGKVALQRRRNPTAVSQGS